MHQFEAVRLKGDGAGDDASPRVTNPAVGDTFNIMQDRACGYVAYCEFAAAQTADVEIWVNNKDDLVANGWALAGTIVGIANAVMFGQDDIGHARIYFRIINRTDGSDMQIWAAERYAD